MAAASARAAPPLTLRDFLELTCESSSDGFRSYPRRLPCDPDRGGGGALLAAQPSITDADLRRSPSRSLSSYFVFPRSPRSLAKISRLSRSLSQRLRDSFSWRRRGGGDYIDERDSFGLPSPLVSSCSASESSEYASDSETETHLMTEEKCASGPEKPSPSSSTTSSSCCTGSQGAADATADRHKAIENGEEAVGRRVEMQDKQQLSPVSVMDFPFDDDGEERSDAGTCSPSFQDRLADMQCSKSPQLLHKTRRFDGVEQIVNPVDLEPQFTTSDSGQTEDAHTWHSENISSNDHSETTAPPRSDEHQSMCSQEEHEPDEHRLLRRLLKGTAATDDISEQLFLDFFAEGADRHRASAGPVRPWEDHEESALVREVEDWLRGAGPQWGIRDVLLAGEATLADMVQGRRWMCLGDDEREVAVDVEGMVMDALVAEVVSDLPGCRRKGSAGLLCGGVVW